MILFGRPPHTPKQNSNVKHQIESLPEGKGQSSRARKCFLSFIPHSQVHYRSTFLIFTVFYVLTVLSLCFYLYYSSACSLNFIDRKIVSYIEVLYSGARGWQDIHKNSRLLSDTSLHLAFSPQFTQYTTMHFAELGNRVEN